MIMEKLHDTVENIRTEWQRLNEAHGYPNPATRTYEQAAIELDPEDETKAYLDLSGSKHLFVDVLPDAKVQIKAKYAGKIVDVRDIAIKELSFVDSEEPTK